MNQYLMPANSKKSRLIFGFFTIRDLIVCGIGGVLTIALLIIFQNPKIFELLLAIFPLLTAAFLVFPIANYHNVMQLLINIYEFYFVRRRKYYWRGWCVKEYGKDND